MKLSDGVVTLRPPAAHDAPEIASAVQASLTELQVFMPWATSDYGPAEARQWMFGEFNPGEEPFIILDADDEIIGSCGLGPIDQLNRVIELGYWVRSDRTGQGIATRAAHLLTRHAIDNRGAMRVEIHMSVENPGSRRVAENVGAVFEGIMRARLLLNGEYHDAEIWSILATDPHNLVL